MRCHGGSIPLGSSGQTVHIAGYETDRLLKEPETRLSYFRQVIRNQFIHLKLKKLRKDSAWKLTSLDLNSSTFIGNPLHLKLEIQKPSGSYTIEGRYDGMYKKSSIICRSDVSGSQAHSRSSDKEQSRKKSTLNAVDSSGEDWRSLSRALASGQKVSVISNYDLMKIAELRFSTDMNQGDSGSQVMLLQKALFWLGHLRKRSDITGYFGIETLQALREFQGAHGVSQTGLWGPLSKQALWHVISAEIMHRAADEKSSKLSEARHHDCGKKADVFTKKFQSWTPMKLADVYKARIPEGDWGLLSGIALLVSGVFVGLLISKVFLPFQRNAMKRRIVQSTTSEKQDFVGKKVEPTGEVNASDAHDKVRPGSMFISSLGHGVQSGPPRDYSVNRKASYSTENSSSRSGTSERETESLRRKQSGPWRQPFRASVPYTRTKEIRRLPRSQPSAQNMNGHHTKDNDSGLTLPSNKSSVANKGEPLVPPRSIGGDFQITNGNGLPAWQDEEPNVQKRIEELRKAVQAAEQNGQAAVLALAEERKRSRELELKISRQRESAASLEEELRVLKESHDALLESLRKNIGSATHGSSLLYQDFQNDENNGASQ
ncbi:hypothetical protein KP509_29G052100 [Ceratopteris richardii]|uniref:Peptidoglycan binding-like domain-containing protein n=1 Tax=Ceratopteris richardii TaxID=49495 RepID=A0A8T2R9C5_CERRI|nr:hypothetical protein KP509_29G052100 [Ceratopteris richardii]KAH7292114.1 hypothetical protein KP509_29G052100 [Ceratopteris richardii]